MAVIEITNLTKKYNRNKAVEGLNLTINQGSIFGFLGKNGAGKTTTLRMIMGLIKPTDGEIRICGERVEFGRNKTNRFIGYLPDVPEFYSWMTSKEYLQLCGSLQGMEKGEINERIEELLGIVVLPNDKKKIGGFSRGMKQRLGIAQALIHRPKVLLMDEPTSALDPMGRKEILDILLSLKKEHTILFSTHIITDVERICDSIGILDKGNIKLEGNINELKKLQTSHEIKLIIGEAYKMDSLINHLKSLPFIIGTGKHIENTVHVTCNDIQLFSRNICSILSSLDISLSHLEEMEINLEDVFVEVVNS
ncbi:MAG: ABC transporter ATP-binding protein [Eubacteriales bacterium]